MSETPKEDGSIKIPAATCLKNAAVQIVSAILGMSGEGLVAENETKFEDGVSTHGREWWIGDYCV